MPISQAHNKLWFLLTVFLSSPRICTHVPFLPPPDATDGRFAGQPTVASPGGVCRQRCQWTFHGSGVSYAREHLKLPALQGCEEPGRAPRSALVPSKSCLSQRNSHTMRDLFPSANKLTGSHDADVIFMHTDEHTLHDQAATLLISSNREGWRKWDPGRAFVLVPL